MELKNFQFENQEIRIVQGADGEYRWVARDVVEAMGYEVQGGIGKYIKHVPEEWKGTLLVSTLVKGGNSDFPPREEGIDTGKTPYGKQEMAVLTEQGLYFFLGRSDKPAALPFQKWLAGDVLPSIRKTGSYSTPQAEQLSFTDQLIQINDPIKLERLSSAFMQKANLLRKLAEIDAELATYGYRSASVRSEEISTTAKSVKSQERVIFSPTFFHKQKDEINAEAKIAEWLQGRDATTTREAMEFLGVKGRAWENWLGGYLRHNGFKRQRVRSHQAGPLSSGLYRTNVFYR